MASHGTDQLIVQRLLSCRSLGDARKALVGSAFFVMIQFAIFLAVGALLWVYYGGQDVASLGLTRADEIFPKFIVEQLPTGWQTRTGRNPGRRHEYVVVITECTAQFLTQ